MIIMLLNVLIFITIVEYVTLSSLSSSFLQDISYRSIYSDAISSSSSPLATTVWELLPFSSLSSKHQLVSLPSCSLVLNNNKLYMTKRLQNYSSNDKLNLKVSSLLLSLSLLL